MEFKNEHNEKLVLPLAWWKRVVNVITNTVKYATRTIWLSRAVAVVASVVVMKDGVPYLLINQRGSGTPDFQGFWNLPCGYLDKNETTGEATIREVYEECGVNLIELGKTSSHSFMEQPWHTNSTPDANRQNVTFHHGLIAKVDELPSTSLENNEPDEVAEVKWIRLEDYKQYEYAFNHVERIEHFMKLTLLDLHLSEECRSEMLDYLNMV